MHIYLKKYISGELYYILNKVQGVALGKNFKQKKMSVPSVQPFGQL